MKTDPPPHSPPLPAPPPTHTRRGSINAEWAAPRWSEPRDTAGSEIKVQVAVVGKLKTDPAVVLAVEV